MEQCAELMGDSGANCAEFGGEGIVQESAVRSDASLPLTAALCFHTGAGRVPG